MESIFNSLNTIDVNDHVEPKGKFNYLSWAWAWAEVAKKYEDVTYKVMHNANGWNYFTDGRTGWVETEVTINSKTVPMQLPIMDFNNKSLPVEKITSFDVNKAIMRCLTKNLALFGLGLYIYSGEDLPEMPQTAEEPATAKDTAKDKKAEHKANKPVEKPKKSTEFVFCNDCNRPIVDIIVDGNEWSRHKIAEHSTNSFGKPLCYECAVKRSNAKSNK